MFILTASINIYSDKVSRMEKRIGELFGASTLGMAVALGSKLGMFKAIKGLPDRWTDVQLANATGCKLRYVTEWLATMVCGDIIKLDTTTDKDIYYMSSDDNNVMTNGGDGLFMLLDTFAHRYPTLIECFKNDGPRGFETDYIDHAMLPYDGFRKHTAAAEFRDYILPRMPTLLNKLNSGINVADVGCGTGNLTHYIAKTFPSSEVLGMDLFHQPLEQARRRAEADELTNLKYDLVDIMQPPDTFTKKFDLVIACIIIHDLPFPEQALVNINSIMKDDGFFLFMDVNLPSGLRNQLQKTPPPFCEYGISLFECLPTCVDTPGAAGMGMCVGDKALLDCAKLAKFDCIESFPVGENESTWLACHVCQKTE